MRRPQGDLRSRRLATSGETRPDPFAKKSVALPGGLPGKVASAEATKHAVRLNAADDEIGDALSALAALEIDADAETAAHAATALATVNRELPAVVGGAIERFQGRAPTFHKATNLPIFTQPRLRAAGRALMSNYTGTPLEEMMVVSDLAGGSLDVEALGIFLDRYGEKVPDDVMEAAYGLSVAIPGIEGYRAETGMWTFNDYTFLHVQDKWSESIYCWATDREPSPGVPTFR